MIIVIFGPPGSGKGTQSNILLEKYNLQLISVGDLLRSIISSKSDLGKKIKDVVESGNLIQDDIICELLHNQITSMGDNVLLDGFPRNLNQAHFLTQALKEKYDRDVDFIIELKVEDSIVVNRLQNRLICLDCKSVSSFCNVVCVKCGSEKLERRVDDVDMSAIQKRISEYHMQMKSLREYYEGKLLVIDASLSIGEVAGEIESKISCNFV